MQVITSHSLVPHNHRIGELISVITQECIPYQGYNIQYDADEHELIILQRVSLHEAANAKVDTK